MSLLDLISAFFFSRITNPNYEGRKTNPNYKGRKNKPERSNPGGDDEGSRRRWQRLQVVTIGFADVSLKIFLWVFGFLDC